MIILSVSAWNEFVALLNAPGVPNPDIVALARSRAPWDMEPLEHDGEFIPAEYQRAPSGAPRCWRLANRWAVPHTGRRSGGHYFRRPRGKLQALANDARSVPPDSWDDIHFSTRGDRNWKQHRKTQWHERYTV